MKRRKYALMLLLTSVLAASAGCSPQKEVTAQTAPAPTAPGAPTPSHTNTSSSDSSAEDLEESSLEDLKAVPYTSKDNTFTILLPDTSWKVSLDDGNNAVFDSADTGTISVIRMADKSQVNIPKDETAFRKNLKKSGKAPKNYKILDFRSQIFAKDIGWYKYSLKCSDEEVGYSYAATYIIATDTEIFSITGLVKTEDEDLLLVVKESIDTFIYAAFSEDNTQPADTPKEEEPAAEQTDNTAPAEEAPLEAPPAAEEAPAGEAAPPLEPDFAYSNSFPIFDGNGNQQTVYLKNDDWQWHGADGTLFQCGDYTLTDEQGNIFYYDISDVPFS